MMMMMMITMITNPVDLLGGRTEVQVIRGVEVMVMVSNRARLLG